MHLNLKSKKTSICYLTGKNIITLQAIEIVL